jgi:sialate O-acetylesterase
MIAPLIPFGIRGAIWYQGESNAGRAVEYRKLFPAMISDWRKNWGQGDFTFLFVQLPNFMARDTEPKDDGWPWLREAQLMTLSLPNTGMAITIDVGEEKDIHPKNKQDVGLRLSRAAQKIAYGKDAVHSGPVYETGSMKVEGDKAVVKFKHLGGGLVAKGGGPSTGSGQAKLVGFAIAGEDRKFVWAEGTITPPTGSGKVPDTVVVSSKDVGKPVAVRYAWANNPDCNLYNKEGLPACPFRTDDWPMVTAPKPAPATPK